MPKESSTLVAFIEGHKKELKLLTLLVVVLRITPVSWKSYLRQSLAGLLRMIADVVDISYILPLPTLLIQSMPAIVKQMEKNSKVVVPAELPRSIFPPHRHSTSLNKALALVTTLTDLSSWTLLSVNQQVSIYTQQTDLIPLPFVRGQAKLSGFTVNEWVSVIRSSVARGDCKLGAVLFMQGDERFVSSTAVEVFNGSESVSLSVQKGSFAVAAREFLVAQSVVRDSCGKTVVVVTSVDDDTVAVGSGRVRADLILGAWTLEAVEGGVLVDYIVGVDFKGTVPEYLVKMVQSSTPMCIMKVHGYLKDKGSVPFVLVNDAAYPNLSMSSDITLMSEDYNKNGVSLTVKCKIAKTKNGLEKKSLTFVLSKEFAGGVNVKIVALGGAKVKFGGQEVSEAKICSSRIVQVWFDGNVDADLELEICPSQSSCCMLNGSTMNK